MKKILLTLVLLWLVLFPVSVVAQQNPIDAGSFEFGIGNIANLWLQKGDNYDEATDISIGSTPVLTFGYFVSDGIMLGASIYYESYKSESMTDPDTDFLLQPQLKYYIPVSSQTLANLRILAGYSSSTYDGDSETYTRTRFGLGGGLTYLLLPGLGAVIHADYIYFPNRAVSGTTIDNSSYNIIEIGVGLSAYF